MRELKDKYLLDVPYTWGFFSVQSPTIMNYAARTKGLEVKPIREPFTYCELGCGNGMTSNVLAAALPHGHFYAVDLNPEHIANAKRVAERGGLSNITFLEDSFGGLLEQDLPEFDYITLHGVYSWVSPEVREDIRKVIERFLKPNGLVYISYNTLPGWAPLQPLRQIMWSYTSHMKEDSLQKARKGLEYLKYLRDQKAPFFQSNPPANKFLDKMIAHNLSYIAHEYFNQSWQPQYFSEVAAEMGRIGLRYYASPALARNYTDIIVPERFRPLLATATDDIHREIHKSLILNEFFRYDLYCKNPRFLPVEERWPLFADTVFGSNVLTREIKRETKVGGTSIRYSGTLYDDLIPAAAEGTRTAAEICALPALQGAAPLAVAGALQKLVIGGQFNAFAAKAPASDGTTLERFRIASAFNRSLLEDRLIDDAQCFLASPVLGSGIKLTIINGLILRAWERNGPDGVVESVDQALAELVAKGRTWKRRGQAVTDPAERRRFIEEDLALFRSRWIPLMLRYGLIEPVA